MPVCRAAAGLERRPVSRRQSKSIESTLTKKILRRRTFCGHLAPRCRQDHLDREIADVWRDDPAGGRSGGAGERRRVRSDWTAVEREHGISVSSAVMSFGHEGLAFNLLDPPPPSGFQCVRRTQSAALIPVSYLMRAKLLARRQPKPADCIRPTLSFSATWRHLPPALLTLPSPGGSRSTMWLP
jgi:hypothetical protein